MTLRASLIRQRSLKWAVLIAVSSGTTLATGTYIANTCYKKSVERSKRIALTSVDSNSFNPTNTNMSSTYLRLSTTCFLLAASVVSSTMMQINGATCMGTINSLRTVR